MNGTDRTICEGDRDQNIVVVVAARAVGGSNGVDADWECAAKELHHVDEVPAFANKASPLVRMLHPVRGRGEAGVHAIVHRQRLRASGKQALDGAEGLGKTAVVA